MSKRPNRWVDIPGLDADMRVLKKAGLWTHQEIATELQDVYRLDIQRLGLDPMTANMVTGQLNRAVILARKRKARTERLESMRGLNLEAMEAKAMDFQTASAIAYNTLQMPWDSAGLIAAQSNQRLASMAARRYLWAAIERKAENNGE